MGNMALTLKQAGTSPQRSLSISVPTRYGQLALKNPFTKVVPQVNAVVATRTRDSRRSHPGRNTGTADPALASASRTIVPVTGGLLTP